MVAIFFIYDWYNKHMSIYCSKQFIYTKTTVWKHVFIEGKRRSSVFLISKGVGLIIIFPRWQWGFSALCFKCSPSSMQVWSVCSLTTMKKLFPIVSVEPMDHIQLRCARQSLRLNLKVCVAWWEEMKHFKTMVNHSAVSLNAPVSRCFCLVKQLGGKAWLKAIKISKKQITVIV